MKFNLLFMLGHQKDQAQSIILPPCTGALKRHSYFGGPTTHQTLTTICFKFLSYDRSAAMSVESLHRSCLCRRLEMDRLQYQPGELCLPFYGRRL